MINFFPELKKPRSDGLASALGLEDLRNPYEIYFGLFGEDDSSDGAADNNPVDAEAGRFSGRGNTQAAAGTPSRGTTFGVDGRSKTGSTALDAAIGYTDDDNRGNPGANFDALNNATTQQTIAAVAAAREAQDRGGSPGQVESAVASALDNYSTGTVDRSGGLTDKGRSFVDDIVNQTFAPPPSLLTSDPNEIFDFDITQNRNVSTDDLSPSTPSMALPGSLPASRSAEVSRALSRSSSAVLSRPDAGVGSGIPRNLIDDELKTRAEAGDRIAQNFFTPSPYELATDSRVPAVGIMTTPQATAANVLGMDRSNPNEMAARESNMARMAIGDAGMITDASPRSNQVVLGGGTDNMGDVNDPRFGGSDFSNQVVLGGGTDNMNLVNDARFGGPATLPTAAATVRDLQRARDGLRTTAPAPGGITTIQGPTAQDLANLDALAKAGFDDDTAEMGIRGPGSGYDARGLPTGLQTFTNNQGITATTNLAGLTQAQRDNLPGYMNPKEGGLQDTIFGNPLDTAYGYELDAQGNVTGILGRPGGGGMVGAGMELLTNALLGPPESVEDLLNRSVYTGYGPGSQVGMDGSDDGREMSKPPTDPCPDGFVLKDGVCTPVDQAGEDTGGGPGSDFIMQPPIAPPTFQPITQGTPISQINPFVLQPYTPMQAQNIGASRVAQGIQPMSPTGAALGRQI